MAKDYNLLRMTAESPALSPMNTPPSSRSRGRAISWIWIGLLVSIPLHGVLLAILSSISSGVGALAGTHINAIEVSFIEGDLLEPAPSVVAGGSLVAPELHASEADSGSDAIESIGLPVSTGNESGESPIAAAGGPGLFASGGGGGIGTGGGGLGGETTFFGVGGRGKRIGYVVDKSGSMGTHGRMRFAKEEILRSINALPDFALVCIAFFDDDFDTLDRDAGFIRCRRPEIAKLTDWILDIEQKGGTDPIPAFQFLFTRRDRPDVVFFMSDGEIASDAADEILRLNRRGPNSVIHCIAFGHEAAAAPLRRIAAETGGTFSAFPQGRAP